MKCIINGPGKTVSAWRLGDPEPTLEKLMEEGRIRDSGDHYEVFSREAAAGGSGHGEIAHKGDYIKVDEGGLPYPNKEDWFLENHCHLEGSLYRQIPHPLAAWEITEPQPPELLFLLRSGRLLLHPEDPEHYFTAFLFGTLESAPRDAVILFYSVTRSGDGSVTAAEFNFVAREEFDQKYSILRPKV